MDTFTFLLALLAVLGWVLFLFTLKEDMWPFPKKEYRVVYWAVREPEAPLHTPWMISKYRAIRLSNDMLYHYKIGSFVESRKVKGGQIVTPLL